MDRYHESTTIVSEDATQRLVDEHKARVWRNPRNGVTRYYLGLDALKDIIGLDVNFYYSGNVRRCSYIDAEGEIVRVANSRAYNRWTQTFIENGRVYTEWAPYGEDIAELIALNIAKDQPERQAQVIEARDPRTIGAKGGRNVKLGPVRRIRKSGKNKQSEENE